MNTREANIAKVRATLAKTGFYISQGHDLQNLCFDLVARRDEMLLFIKVLVNIDGLSKESAEELRILANTLPAAPLIIGARCGAGEIRNGIIYSRFGIPIISIQTFEDLFIEGVPPFVFAAPGGLYVRLDGEVLRKARENKRISLGTLAKIAGVSRKAIQMYEEGMGAKIEIALQIENFLDEPIVLPINPFSYSRETEKVLVDFDKFEEFGRDVFRHLNELGFNVMPTLKCPFDALTQDRTNLFLTGVSKNGKKLLQKVRTVANLSRIIERSSVFFVVKHKAKFNLEGTPLIERDELRKIKDSETMLELIDERSLDRSKRKSSGYRVRID